MINTTKSPQPKQLEVKPLPEELIKNNFRYKQIMRNDHKALFEQKYRNSDTVVAFELFQIKHRTKQDPITGNSILCETFPHNEAFGESAWSLSADGKDALKKAIKRYNKLGKPKKNERK